MAHQSAKRKVLVTAILGIILLLIAVTNLRQVDREDFTIQVGTEENQETCKQGGFCANSTLGCSYSGAPYTIHPESQTFITEIDLQSLQEFEKLWNAKFSKAR